MLYFSETPVRSSKTRKTAEPKPKWQNISAVEKNIELKGIRKFLTGISETVCNECLIAGQNVLLELTIHLPCLG